MTEMFQQKWSKCPSEKKQHLKSSNCLT